jgi:hypothetical protein
MCIRCRSVIFTKPLHSNCKGIHIQTHTLMGRIYEVCCWYGLRCHDMHTKFHKNWFRHSKVDGGGGIHRDTDSMVISEAYFYFFKIRKGSLWDHLVVCVCIHLYLSICQCIAS